LHERDEGDVERGQTQMAQMAIISKIPRVPPNGTRHPGRKKEAGI